MPGPRRKVIVGAFASVLALLVVAFFVVGGPRPYDPAFDTRVAEPAYRTGGPVVLYDEGHLNTHEASGGYKPLADLLRHDGYVVRVTKEPLSAPSLAGVSVLLIVLARGSNDTNDEAAFSVAEIDVVDRWVRGGGSLLLVTDHWPYGSAVGSLAVRFGVHMGAGLVEDPGHHDPERGDSHLVFSTDNGLLRDHPIVRGRNVAERIRSVLTFTGQSIGVPAAAVPFLALSADAIERPPGVPRASKTGGDVRVDMEYLAPVPAAGRAQGIALEVEAGRLVVLGEAGMLRAHKGDGGERVGMNVPPYDNRQLALNVLHWLSRAL